MFRTSSWMTHRSEDASLRPKTSRIALGDITATIGGIRFVGPNWIRVMGPPASRITSCPVSSLRTNFTNCQIGSGFFGTNGRALTSTFVVMSVIIVQAGRADSGHGQIPFTPRPS